MAQRRVCVGAIAGAYGVRGEVRLKSFCATPEAIGDYGPLASDDGADSFVLKGLRHAGNGLVAGLQGVATREQAEALRGTRLYADRGRLPDLPDDEFYHADLVGLEMRDPQGAVLGHVRAVHDHGAGDLLEVARPEGGEPVLVPFTRTIVPTVDITAGVIVADPPEGLFD